MYKNKKCPHCFNEVECFHKKSHILPKWTHKELFDEKHKLIVVHSKGKRFKNQSGFHGEFICKSCEDSFAKDDHYISLVVQNLHKSVSKKNIKYPTGELLDIWDGINPAKFQNFTLGIILRDHYWRESRNENAMLNLKHLSEIQSLYKTVEARKSYESYPIVVAKMRSRAGLETINMLPFKSRRRGVNFIDFNCAGLQFSLQVSSHQALTFPKEIWLSSESKINIIHTEIEGGNSLKQFVSSYKKNKK